jgi:hypothetical protein
MGSAISIVSDDKNVPCTAGRKRPYPFESEPFLEHEETETFSPARKQLRPTARYIFESLFEHGVQSDITVKAIGRLHVCRPFVVVPPVVNLLGVRIWPPHVSLFHCLWRLYL